MIKLIFQIFVCSHGLRCCMPVLKPLSNHSLEEKISLAMRLMQPKRFVNCSQTNRIPAVKYDAAHQKGGLGRWSLEFFFFFLFDVLELFLRFKIYGPFIKIDQGIQILQVKKRPKIFVFVIIFWMFSFISKKAHIHKVPLPFWSAASQILSNHKCLEFEFHILKVWIFLFLFCFVFCFVLFSFVLFCFLCVYEVTV